jgi:hypothetical protein
MVDTLAMLRSLAFLFAASSLLLGCGSDSSKPDAAAKPTVAGQPSSPVDNPHASDPHPQAPHTAAPNPHAQAPQAAPAGPPRDITPSGETR